MKKATLTALLAAVILASGLATPAFAQQRIDERLYRMERRIDRGVADGSLNRREARELRAELSRIRDREARMRSDDGRLDRRERERLHYDIDRLERHIFRERRN